MIPPLLTLQNIHVRFGKEPLLDGAQIILNEGERLCLIGRNGSGKSTLLKIAAGLISADDGVRFVRPNTTMRYLPQEPDLSAFDTTLDYVKSGLNAGDESYRAIMLLEQLGLTGAENPRTLSGGEARRAALAAVLAPNPDILMLDEPTNHLDLPTIEWLEQELKSMRCAMMMISHDRRFLSNLSRTTLWLDRGITHKVSIGFDGFEAWRDDFLEQEEVSRHKLSRKINAELDWVRYGVSGRRKRNVKRMADLQTLKSEYKNARKAVGAIKFDVAEAEISGKTVIDARRISKHYDHREIVNSFSIRISRGDRIGIVGANGAGKTTLLNMLIGEMAPDSGTIKRGTNIEIATLDQRRALLQEDATLQDVLTGGSGDHVFVGGQPRHVIGYMKDFLFTADQMRSPVKILSGGERGRLLLAKALATPSNFLVLDEPTNDLDLETLDLLQEMIADYSGTVMLISHDRDFLDRTVTSIIMAEGNGQFTTYAGGYSDMLIQRGIGIQARASRKIHQLKHSERDVSAEVQPIFTQQKGKQSSLKMSFKDKHALETLPKDIEKLEDQIHQLKIQLENPALYNENPLEFTKLSERLQKLDLEKTQCEEKWLALEILKEEMNNS